MTVSTLLRRSRTKVFNVNYSTTTTLKKRFASSQSQESDVTNCDIVILGGGVVGLALANAFASCRAILDYGYRISVLDAGDLSRSKVWDLPPNQWSNRVSSVTNENLEFLEKIGVSKYLNASRTNPVERMQVWDGLSNARIIFDSLDGNHSIAYDSSQIPQMARFIENAHLQRAMLQSLDQTSNVDILGSTKVASIVADEANWPILNLENGKRLRARLLVGADGFNSPVKSYSKISSTGWNYDSHCVVGTLELEPTQFNYTAWQRFLVSGPLGLLPLSDRCASLAWSTKPNIAAGLKSLDGPTLANAINACYQLPHDSVHYLLSRIGSHSATEPISSVDIQSEIDWRSSSLVNAPPLTSEELPPRVLDVRMETVASFPLKMFHADQYIGTTPSGGTSGGEIATGPTRTALVGDAAHVLHPMAGQGLNMGLGDARELANVVRIALENGQDIGGLTALKGYARSRYFSNHLIMSTVDKLNKLYSLEAFPIVWARSVGVEVLNEIPGLKAAMMGTAGGKTHPHQSQIDKGGLWSTVADLYEGAQKVRILAEGVGGFALGTIKSSIHRFTSS